MEPELYEALRRIEDKLGELAIKVAQWDDHPARLDRLETRVDDLRLDAARANTIAKVAIAAVPIVAAVAEVVSRKVWP